MIYSIDRAPEDGQYDVNSFNLVNGKSKFHGSFRTRPLAIAYVTGKGAKHVGDGIYK